MVFKSIDNFINNFSIVVWSYYLSYLKTLVKAGFRIKRHFDFWIMQTVWLHFTSRYFGRHECRTIFSEKTLAIWKASFSTLFNTLLIIEILFLHGPELLWGLDSTWNRWCTCNSCKCFFLVDISRFCVYSIWSLYFRIY